MPSLVQLQQEMGPKITVLAVSVDDDERKYHKFLLDHNITNLLTVMDPQKKSPDLYGTVQYPETYIIDASGTVRRKLWNAVDFTSPDIVEYLSKM